MYLLEEDPLVSESNRDNNFTTSFSASSKLISAELGSLTFPETGKSIFLEQEHMNSNNNTVVAM